MSNSNYFFKNGVHTVLVTPFVEGTCEVDYDDLHKWVAYQAITDVAGLVLLGSTSESSMLSREEKLQIIKNVHELNSFLSSPKFITVGISGSNDIREIIDFAEDCVKYCDAFMITVPHYTKPPQEGIIKWFQQICSHPELINMPVIMYNIPGRTCMNMLPETMKEICDTCPNVVAVKEASGSIDQMTEILRIIPGIKLFSGDDGMTIDVIKIGGVGVISVASNVIPTEMVELTRFCMNSEFLKAEQIKQESKLDNFLSALFCESNPIPVKFMLYQCGVFKSYQMRLPLVPLRVSKHNEVLQALFITGQYSGELNSSELNSSELNGSKLNGSKLNGSELNGNELQKLQ